MTSLYNDTHLELKKNNFLNSDLISGDPCFFPPLLLDFKSVAPVFFWGGAALRKQERDKSKSTDLRADKHEIADWHSWIVILLSAISGIPGGGFPPPELLGFESWSSFPITTPPTILDFWYSSREGEDSGIPLVIWIVFVGESNVELDR